MHGLRIKLELSLSLIFNDRLITWHPTWLLAYELGKDYTVM
jgi:hypothetical protein